jgi:SOS-response transcriptional repressor LexA
MPPAIAAGIKKGQAVYLQAALPGQGRVNIGVLLFDPEEDRLYSRFRRDWDAVAEDEDDREVLEALAFDIEAKASELGAARLLEFLEEHLSNALLVTEREEVAAADFSARLNRLYREHVDVEIRPFRTHLPVFSLRAAAGRLSDADEVEPEGWEEMPADLKLTDDMFVAHVTGHSMEPRIPDGSLCVFKRNVTGSRQGRLLVIEHTGLAENQGRYTIKRYRSEKRMTEEGWEHARVTLEPLNPAYEPWDLAPDEFRVVAEFVRVV